MIENRTQPPYIEEPTPENYLCKCTDCDKGFYGLLDWYEHRMKEHNGNSNLSRLQEYKQRSMTITIEQLKQEIENRVHQAVELELDFAENSIPFHRCEGTINGLLQIYELIETLESRVK